jgi:tetratricopeptide (TPR) repeat protein
MDAFTPSSRPLSRQQSDKLRTAVALHQKGKLEPARVLYQEILAEKPDQADALHMLGLIAIQTQHWATAVTLISRSLEVDPSNPVAYSNRGVALHGLGQPEAALSSLNQSIALNSRNPQAYFGRAVVLRELNFPRDALRDFDRAIVLEPGFVEAHFHSGLTLVDLTRYQAALDRYDRTIALKPDHAEAHINRGNILRKLGRPNEAVSSYTEAIRVRPSSALAYSNRGSALRELRQLEAAVQSYDRAIAIKSDYARAYFNRGVVLTELRQFDQALATYDAVLAIKPDYADAHYLRSLLLLLTGDYSHGWLEHEWRWGSDSGSFKEERRGFSQPLWLGEQSIVNRTVLVYAEQGLGDTLQFSRYASLLAMRGAKVILEVPATLAGLLAQLEGVSQVVVRGAPLPNFDYQCPLMSLPLAFKTTLATVPAAASYLRGDVSKVLHWQRVLGAKHKPRVGLVWRGNPRNPNDHNRSIRLDSLVQGLPTGFQYVSLQKDLTDFDRGTLAENPHILNFDTEQHDFTDAAALCECMDLLISVDTSVAHLSAAMGKPTWILLAFAADWRWLLDRSDTPWYPAARLYRQRRAGAWPEVLARIAADLARTFS